MHGNISEHLSQSAVQGVRYVIYLITQFARFPFPGTDIPVILVILAPWAIYFCWKWVLCRFFNIESKV